jgi:K+-sensing histidine kinase KdpD
MYVFGEFLTASGRASQPLWRRLAGYALAAILVLLLTLLPGKMTPVADAVAILIAVGLVALCRNAARFAMRAPGASAEAEAARSVAEADRARTVLLATVSHDLRTPLAAAKAAVSCLRSGELRLTDEDHDELLATADESLDLLAHLAASLLDMSRLQAGALPIFPRPADLGEIIACSLAGLGPPARAVSVHLPADLPQVTADPAIMERVIANVTANALRYSPAGSAPLLRASAQGHRVELRVIDHGPGVPEADRGRMFAPFQRLGQASTTTGVGLGLAVSRGLAEAMRGTLQPEETPGGGLTMTLSMPAARGPAAPDELLQRGRVHRRGAKRPQYSGLGLPAGHRLLVRARILMPSAGWRGRAPRRHQPPE